MRSAASCARPRPQLARVAARRRRQRRPEKGHWYPRRRRRRTPQTRTRQPSFGEARQDDRRAHRPCLPVPQVREDRRSTSKLHADDEPSNDADEGDHVRVSESRPLSRTKALEAEEAWSARSDRERNTPQGCLRHRRPRSCTARKGGSRRRYALSATHHRDGQAGQPQGTVKKGEGRDRGGRGRISKKSFSPPTARTSVRRERRQQYDGSSNRA